MSSFRKMNSVIIMTLGICTFYSLSHLKIMKLCLYYNQILVCALGYIPIIALFLFILFPPFFGGGGEQAMI
jgi:hypothetical protein